MAKQTPKNRNRIYKKLIPLLILILSFSLIFGLVAGLSGKTQYLTLEPYSSNKTNTLSYADTSKETKWIGDSAEPTSEDTQTSIIQKNKSNNPDQDIQDKNFLYSYCQEVIDGTTHQVLDKSFNNGAYLGLCNWIHQYDINWVPGKDMQIKMEDCKYENQGPDVYSAKASKPASDSPQGFVSSYTAAIDDNVKSLVLPGYIHVNGLISFMNNQAIFSKAGYVLIDSEIANDNIASVNFRSDQCSFLAGFAACQYLQDNYEKVYSKVNNGQLAVGVFGGTPIPNVTIFMGGFEWGVYAYNKYVLPEISKTWTPEQIEKRTVKIIKSGKQSSYFSGTFNAGDAKLTVQQLLAQGADMILPVAGPQTLDTCVEIYNQHSPCGVIGVDTDQELGELGQYTSTSPLNEGEKIIKFSAQKNIAYVVSMILQSNLRGTRGWYTTSDGQTNQIPYDSIALEQESEEIRNSAIGNYGYLTVGNIKNNLVKLSDAGAQYLIRAINSIPGGEGCDDYAKAIKWLDTTPLVQKSKEDFVSLFQMIEDNMYFTY